MKSVQDFRTAVSYSLRCKVSFSDSSLVPLFKFVKRITVFKIIIINHNVH